MTLARQVAVTTASLVASRLLAVLAGVIAVALASRYLGPTSFGALVLSMAIAAFVALFTDLGLSTMAAREIAQAPERERLVLANVLTLGGAAALLACVLMVGVAQVAYADDPLMRRGLLVLCAQVLAAPFLGTARAHLQAAQRGHLLALGDVALAVAMLSATALCVAEDLGYTGLVAAVAVGYVAQAAVLTCLMRRDVRLAVAVAPATWRRLLAISLPLGGTLLINYLYFRLDVFLLAVLVDKEAVALYGIAYRVLEGLMVLPGYFMFALFPEIARISRDRQQVEAIVRAALGAMEVVAVPLVLLGMVFAEEIVAVIADERYAEAAGVLRVLMIALGISYLAGVYGHALVALGRQAAMLRWSTVVLGVNLVANLILIPPFGVVGAAVAVVVSEVLALFVVRRLYARGGRAARLVLEPRMLLAGAVMAAVVAPKFLLPEGELPAWLTIALGGSLGLVAYVVAMAGLGAVPAAIAAQLPRRLARLARNP